MPFARRRTKVMLVAAGLLLVAVVGLAWFMVGEDGTPGGTAAAPPLTTGPDLAAGPTSAAPTTGPERRSGGQVGDVARGSGGDTGNDAGSDAQPGRLGSPAPPAPACRRVLSGAEAAAALGTPVAKVEDRDGFLMRSCTFWSSGERYLLVQVMHGVAASREEFERSRLPADRPVAGIGQAARWTPDSGLLDVLDGTARFQVGLFAGVGGPAAPAPPRVLETAARAIAARL